MSAFVSMTFRIPLEKRSEFVGYCSEIGLSASEALRRMVEDAVERKSIKPDDNIWDVIAKGRLPEGYKNRFAMLPELTKDLPSKDDEEDDPWDVRPDNPWKTREIF